MQTQTNESIPQETNRVFRSIGALTCVINGSILAGLTASWIIQALIKAGFVFTPIGYSLLTTVPFAGVWFWWSWKQNYQSENASLGERFYRLIPLLLWMAGYALGVIHFI